HDGDRYEHIGNGELDRRRRKDVATTELVAQDAMLFTRRGRDARVSRVNTGSIDDASVARRSGSTEERHPTRAVHRAARPSPGDEGRDAVLALTSLAVAVQPPALGGPLIGRASRIDP